MLITYVEWNIEYKCTLLCTGPIVYIFLQTIDQHTFCALHKLY